MIASFFDTSAITEFADWIIGEVKRALPPDAAPLKKKKHQARAQDLDKNIERRVVELTRKTRLNIYKKARLAARVREGMNAHGYPKPFVNSFSLELIKRINAAAKNRQD